MANLVDDFVPFLAAHTDFDGLVYKTCGDDDAVKFVGDAPGGFRDW